MNKLWKITIFFFIISISSVAAQTKISWRTLEGIGFNEKYVPKLDVNFNFPVFSSTLKSLNGQIVEVQGYLIPYDHTGKNIALSSNPYASCFFCGNAGPASVMVLRMKNPSNKIRTDAFKTVRGTLKLNFNDPEEFYYILENAVILN